MKKIIVYKKIKDIIKKNEKLFLILAEVFDAGWYQGNLEAGWYDNPWASSSNRIKKENTMKLLFESTQETRDSLSSKTANLRFVVVEDEDGNQRLFQRLSVFDEKEKTNEVTWTEHVQVFDKEFDFGFEEDPNDVGELEKELEELLL